MCEQKFEQQQIPAISGKKILWIIAPGGETHISKDLPVMLKLAGSQSDRVVYNVLRSSDEIPGWETTSCNFPEEILARVKELQPGDCYILDNLELIQRPGKSDIDSELLSFGKKLFQLTSSRGVNCMILALRHSRKAMEEVQQPPLTPYQYDLIKDTDIFFENDYGRLRP